MGKKNARLVGTKGLGGCVEHNQQSTHLLNPFPRRFWGVTASTVQPFGRLSPFPPPAWPFKELEPPSCKSQPLSTRMEKQFSAFPLRGLFF